jgi:hypothetical protein
LADFQSLVNIFLPKEEKIVNTYFGVGNVTDKERLKFSSVKD